ncbi:coenzyme F420-0:L-glutamate ligase/coenzyme F420-1:gamma-L-glutamate ligase [Okibacterium sp. HSC-33S16]|uniref:coenzyme F420-0:L-glutamate ligase n=1 Tax=Okibacterium sp. HSC-33S16 TaxID=2910965 RepID=UPI0020A21474|nr:coenzyme F420-0:L-glutamate ligase [Okibacterium sp. HSC-33S16]MCP2031408.1 coenzyme F420-0:L-glutamate ligase/coenzyme F420-1:gamma-L-glutamate ligase [Okibacterium sp. HSC-33S16]
MLTVFGLDGIGEITDGDDLAAVITTAATGLIEDGDILLVTSKIVSKAEGRMRHAADREQAITDETVRVVAQREHPNGITRIVENRLGLVMAAAGVDASNTPDGTILLLPVDPDRSARELRAHLFVKLGIRVGVVVTDTVGRPWRDGQTDIAIGAAGIRVIDDLRGQTDASGRLLTVTAAAVADELAAAGDLVKGKTSGRPVAVARGMAHLVTDEDGPGARALVRDAERDMFRLGSDEAYAAGYAAGLAAAKVARATPAG